MIDFRPNPSERLLRDDLGWGPSIGIDAEFRRHAQSNPGAIALWEGDLRLSYAQVEVLANGFAAQVLERAPSDTSRPVLLYARRSAALVVAVLGTIRAGYTFAVLDAAYPAERIRRQVATLAPALIVGVEVSLADVQKLFSSFASVPSWSIARTDFATASSQIPAVDRPPNATAYLLFTSGTTGTPKCIRTGHAPLIHFLSFYRRAFHPGAGDRFSMLSGLSHDPLLRDIFAPLSCGACIVVPDEAIVRAPTELYAWLADASISFVHTTPQMLRLISTGRGERPALTKLSHIFSGGDILTADCASAVRSVAPNAAIVNFYGSSETPQAMGFHVVDVNDRDGIPLGRGVDDVQLLILTEDLRMAEMGATGQIGIRTHFLSSGYLGDPDGTSSKYITSPFTKDPDDRIYLTGDFGYYRPDGAVVGIGRQDDQVKIRGYRVELGEVSRAIEATGLVENCAVLAHATVAGDNQLIAFAVPKGEKAAEASGDFEAKLRSALQAQLPVAMVPARIVRLTSIPLSPNGKVDRKALSALLEQQRHEAKRSLRHDPELAKSLRVLIGSIEDVLEIRIDSLDRSFVDLGGDSLSYVRVCSAIQDALGFLPRDWASRPLRDFSAVLTESGQGGTPSMWERVEFPLFLRALCIVLVVMNHADFWPYASTSTLFVVSGASFARFLAPNIRQTGHLGPVLRFVLRFGLPAMFWQLARSIFLHGFWLPNVILLGTFFQRPGHPLYTFWYLDVLAANVLMLALAVLLGRWVRRGRSATTNASRFTECSLFVAVGLIMALAQVSSGWWDGDVGRASVAPFKWFWMVALGMTIVEARTTAKRLMITLLTVAIVVFAHQSGNTSIWLHEEVINPFFLVVVGIMPWIPSVPLPRFIRRPVVLIASSTLFIYMVNTTVISHLLPRLGLTRWPVITVGAPVLVGIVASKFWEQGQRLVALGLSRLGPRRAAASNHHETVQV